MTPVVKAQALTIGGAWAGFLAVVSVLVLIIGSFLRRVVLKPVQSIGRLCASVTAGD